MTQEQEQKAVTGLMVALDVAKDIKAMSCEEIQEIEYLLLDVSARFSALAWRQEEYKRLQRVEQSTRDGGYAHG